MRWKEHNLAQTQSAAPVEQFLTTQQFVAVPEQAKSSRRRPELDALRGFLLVWMTLTHLPTRASFYTNQPFGFVSAAEGFIFLSALLTGRIFGRKLDDLGSVEVSRRIGARVARLYGYHLLLLGVAFGVVATVAVHTNQPSLQGLVDFYLAHPLRAVLSSILLIYRPPLLDILPMYILFLALTPLALYVGRRWGWNLVLIPSALVWLAAQFGLRMAAFNLTGALTGFRIPFSAMGAFDLYGWQLLWVLGLWLGMSPPKSMGRLAESRLALLLALLAAAVFLFIRQSHYWADLNAGPWVPFTNKWQLGALRLCNFAALGLLFDASRNTIAKWSVLAPFVTLGKASLQVFCAHLLFCFAALALVGDGAGLGIGPQVLIVTATLLGLYLVALVSTRKQGQ